MNLNTIYACLGRQGQIKRAILPAIGSNWTCPKELWEKVLLFVVKIASLKTNGGAVGQIN